jgi:hypothetical protein
MRIPSDEQVKAEREGRPWTESKRNANDNHTHELFDDPVSRYEQKWRTDIAVMAKYKKGGPNNPDGNVDLFNGRGCTPEESRIFWTGMTDATRQAENERLGWNKY